MREILIGCEFSPLFLMERKGVRIGGSGWKGEDWGQEQSRQKEWRDGMHDGRRGGVVREERKRFIFAHFLKVAKALEIVVRS